LILGTYAIIDESVRASLTEERFIFFLPQGTSLWARVDVRQTPENLRSVPESKHHFPPRNESGFVAFTLLEDLNLIYRGNKYSKLAECKCAIPKLKLEAKSVNHAYALISTQLEPARRSHTGNVFKCVYFDDGMLGRDYLCLLEEMRKRATTEFVAEDESSLF
jgi:hypothetical protein